jgi:hypothetical protein
MNGGEFLHNINNLKITPDDEHYDLFLESIRIGFSSIRAYLVKYVIKSTVQSLLDTEAIIFTDNSLAIMAKLFRSVNNGMEYFDYNFVGTPLHPKSFLGGMFLHSDHIFLHSLTNRDKGLYSSKDESTQIFVDDVSSDIVNRNPILFNHNTNSVLFDFLDGFKKEDPMSCLLKYKNITKSELETQNMVPELMNINMPYIDVPYFILGPKYDSNVKGNKLILRPTLRMYNFRRHNYMHPNEFKKDLQEYSSDFASKIFYTMECIRKSDLLYDIYKTIGFEMPNGVLDLNNSKNNKILRELVDRFPIPLTYFLRHAFSITTITNPISYSVYDNDSEGKPLEDPYNLWFIEINGIKQIEKNDCIILKDSFYKNIGFSRLNLADELKIINSIYSIFKTLCFVYSFIMEISNFFIEKIDMFSGMSKLLKSHNPNHKLINEHLLDIVFNFNRKDTDYDCANLSNIFSDSEMDTKSSSYIFAKRKCIFGPNKSLKEINIEKKLNQLWSPSSRSIYENFKNNMFSEENKMLVPNLKYLSHSSKYYPVNAKDFFMFKIFAEENQFKYITTTDDGFFEMYSVRMPLLKYSAQMISRNKAYKRLKDDIKDLKLIHNVSKYFEIDAYLNKHNMMILQRTQGLSMDMNDNDTITTDNDLTSFYNIDKDSQPTEDNFSKSKEMFSKKIIQIDPTKYEDNLEKIVISCEEMVIKRIKDFNNFTVDPKVLQKYQITYTNDYNLNQNYFPKDFLAKYDDDNDVVMISCALCKSRANYIDSKSKLGFCTKSCYENHHLSTDNM